MPRRYAGDIPRGDRQLQVGGRAASGAGRLAAVSGPGRASVAPGRQFAVRAEGAWGLRALAGAFGAFADDARQVMDSEFKIRAKEVAREQTLLGSDAGSGVTLDQLQLPAGDSIGDEAYRRSAILAAKANSDIAVYDDAETLAKQFPGKPEDFRRALNARAVAVLKKTDPNARQELQETFSRVGQRKYLELDEARRQVERDGHRAEIMKATERYGNEAAILARRGDWAGAQAEIVQLSKLVAGDGTREHPGAGPVELGGSGALSLQEIEQQASEARDLIQGQFLKGWVERTTNPRAALAALHSGKSGNGEVDAVLAVTNPRVLDPLASALETEIRSREAEARAAAREAREEARFQAGMIVDNEEAAADLGTTAEVGWEAKVRAGLGDRAQPVIDRINHRRDTALAVRDLSTMPTADMAGLIEGRMPEGEGYAYEAKDLALLQTAAAKVLEKREKDPAAEVLRSFPSVAEAMKNGQSGAALKEMARIQTENFGLPANRVQLLTSQQAADAVGAFKAAVTVDDRMAQLQSITTAIGDDTLARGVLSQLEEKGLPPGARFALEAIQERGDIDAAREILGGLSVDPKDLPKVAETKASAIGTAVDSLMAGTTQAGLTQRVANMSREPSLFARARAEREEMIRLTTERTAAGDDPETAASKAERAIFGAGGVAGNDDLGYVRAPKGADVNVLTDALEQARASIDLSNYAPVLIVRPGQTSTGAEQQAYDFALRDHEAKVQIVRDGGIWTNTDGGFALLNPTDGRQVAFKTLAELMAGYRSPTAPTPDPGLVAPGLGGDDGLSGDSGLDRLAPGVGGKIEVPLNPQLSVLLQRFLNSRPAPTYNPKLDPKELGIEPKPKS